MGVICGRHHDRVNIGVAHAVQGVVENGGGRHLGGGAFGKPNVAVGNSADLRLRLQAGEDLQVRGAHVA